MSRQGSRRGCRAAHAWRAGARGWGYLPIGFRRRSAQAFLSVGPWHCSISIASLRIPQMGASATPVVGGLPVTEVRWSLRRAIPSRSGQRSVTGGPASELLDARLVEFEAGIRTQRHRECAVLRLWSVVEEGIAAAWIVRHVGRLGKVHRSPHQVHVGGAPDGRPGWVRVSLAAACSHTLLFHPCSRVGPTIKVWPTSTRRVRDDNTSGLSSPL